MNSAAGCGLNSFHLEHAVRVLGRGGIVMHATEGVWGLACDPLNDLALASLVDLKARAANKGLILIGHDCQVFQTELAPLPGDQRQMIVETWPGPATWLVPAPSGVHPLVTGGGPLVALRVPGHPQVRALCRKFGRPLVSTSANFSGRPAPRNRWQARRLATRGFGSRLGYLLPGETLGRRGPSVIRAASGELMRAGE